jgi:hypothetical protein
LGSDAFVGADHGFLYYRCWVSGVRSQENRLGRWSPRPDIRFFAG